MSRKAVVEFYRHLDQNEEARREALSLQERFSDPERVLDEFFALAERCGFHFTEVEFFEAKLAESEENAGTLQ